MNFRDIIYKLKTEVNIFKDFSSLKIYCGESDIAFVLKENNVIIDEVI